MTNHFSDITCKGKLLFYFQFSVNQASLRISYILFFFNSIGRYFRNSLFKSILIRLFSKSQ